MGLVKGISFQICIYIYIYLSDMDVLNFGSVFHVLLYWNLMCLNGVRNLLCSNGFDKRVLVKFKHFFGEFYGGKCGSRQVWLV